MRAGRVREIMRGFVSGGGRAHAGRPPTQVGVIAVRRGSKETQICLIRRKGSGKWGIPKGFIDQGDTPEQAALNEAWEEAGLRGELIGDPIGTYVYQKWDARLTVAVYVMKVLDEQKVWPEMELRARRWSSLVKGSGLLASHPVRPLLDRVMSQLTDGVA